MGHWTGEIAADRLSNQGFQCHYKGTKSANFSVLGGDTRQISVALDRNGTVTVYVNYLSVAGHPYPENGIAGVERIGIYKKGHEGKNNNPGIAGSVARKNSSLDPKNNDVLRLRILDETGLARLMAWYTNRSANFLDSDEVKIDAAKSAGIHHDPAGLSPEDFLRQQERKNEIGAAGELIAEQEERRRLREECGCSDPEKFVRRVSLDDVSLGYDIESSLPGHERSIEVKSSISRANGFYLSKNERRVLTKLGTRGWIYLVQLDQHGNGRVIEQLRDPIQMISESAFEPVLWRVELPKQRNV